MVTIRDIAMACLIRCVETENGHAGRFGLFAVLAVLMAFPPQPVAADALQPIVYFHPAASIVPAKGYGLDFPDIEGPVAGPNGEMADIVKQSIGCIIGGTIGTGAAVAAGPQNIVNLIAGGLVPANSTLAFYVGLTGVVFASFCAIGQTLTPLYLYYFDSMPPVEIAPPEMDAPPAARTGIPIRFD